MNKTPPTFEIIISAAFNSRVGVALETGVYFMLFDSLSENNGGLSLDNFTVSSSEIIIQRANRLFSDISGIRLFAIRRFDWLTI